MPSAKGDLKNDFEAYRELLRKGMTVGDFLKSFKPFIARVRDAGLAGPFRLAKKESGIDLKKLRDEIFPVARFVRKHAQSDDRISFRLDNGFPDCTVCHQNGLKREIEVTLARGLARFHEMTELNECGESRGLVELQDDASQAVITAAKKRPTTTYSSDEAIDSVVRAVEIRAKGKQQHQGHTLLIEVVPDMYALSKDRWLCLRARLANDAAVKALKFSEVYVTSICGEGDLVLQIK